MSVIIETSKCVIKKFQYSGYVVVTVAIGVNFNGQKVCRF